MCKIDCIPKVFRFPHATVEPSTADGENETDSELAGTVFTTVSELSQMKSAPQSTTTISVEVAASTATGSEK